jgi:hypothetical protein
MRSSKHNKSMSNLEHDVEVQAIGIKKANEYLDGTFERNRPIVRDAVDYYATQMESGEFLNATPIIMALIETTNRVVLVDGQHRLSAVVKSKKSMNFTMMTYYLQNESQLAILYATIDVGRTRNLNDNVRAHGLPEELGMSQADSAMLASASLFAEKKRPAFEVRARGNGSYVDQIDRAKKYRSEGVWYFEILKLAPKSIRNLARRKAIVACALITLKGYPSKAKDFWRGVLLLDNIAQGDVRWRLHMKIVDIFNRTDSTRRGMTVNSRALAAIVCTCWNAYSAGRDLKVINPIRTIVFNRCRWREEKAREYKIAKGKAE